MKKMILFVFAGFAIASCNQGAATTEADKDSVVTTKGEAMVIYPYTIEHPDSWETGSKENTVTALTALKAYENGNIEECVKYFGDSVHLQFDGLDSVVNRQQLQDMFSKSRGDIKSMEIKMDDWESVISKDKSAEYVSIWYKETWEDKSGKKDSVMHMDDLRMKNGKIVALDEKSRKYPEKKM